MAPRRWFWNLKTISFCRFCTVTSTGISQVCEQALEVTIASRGNTVTITGEAAATEIARVCLEKPYRRLVDGLEVSAGEVDAAVRLARSAATEGRGAVEEIASGKTIIRTPKRHLSPRSTGQQKYIGALLDNDLTFGLWSPVPVKLTSRSAWPFRC